VEDRLRLLAHWHARRREVDELLEPLLAHGPAAVDRVSARLVDLAQALEAERAAFEAFAAEAALVAVDEGRGQGPVDEVAIARRRADLARAAMTASVHPSVTDVLEQLDLPLAELHVLETPEPRHPLEEGEPADS
jgi:hypothetical protein